MLPCCAVIIYDVGISFCTTVNLGLIANSDNKSNPKTTANNIYTYKYLLRYCGYLTILEIAKIPTQRQHLNITRQTLNDSGVTTRPVTITLDSLKESLKMFYLFEHGGLPYDMFFLLMSTRKESEVLRAGTCTLDHVMPLKPSKSLI